MNKSGKLYIILFLSGVKYHFVACMAICNAHYKLKDLLHILLNTLFYRSYGILLNFKPVFVLNL